MEGTLAVVTCFAPDFIPRNWMSCNGQILAISANAALFSLLGTTYGGNGTTTFALPDLRGRTPVSQGQSPGLSFYNLGQKSGTESATLTINNLPPHVHNGAAVFHLNANSNDGGVARAVNTFPAKLPGSYAVTANASMKTPAYTGTIGATGTGAPVGIRTPFLAVNYIICLAGIFPSRN
jgi:microcystin-dependent protein